MASHRDIARNEHTMNIRSGIPIMNTRYGLTIDEYDYLDMAIDSLRDIKNFGTTEYYTILEVGKDGVVDLPCNLDVIDALVSYKMGLKEFNTRVKYETEGKKGTDDFYVAREVMRGLDHYPMPGLTTANRIGYISYQLKDNNSISVTKELAGKKIILAYTGITVDLEGYPLITRKQANALAAIAAKYVTVRKINSNNPNAAQLMEYYITEAARLKQAASIPEDFTDNEIDEVLNQMTTFNRKTYKRPTKYSR